jgi:hypothetical protein
MIRNCNSISADVIENTLENCQNCFCSFGLFDIAGYTKYTYIVNPVHGEVYLIQHYVIKFVSDLEQVSGFVSVLRFPPPIKLTAMI